MFLPRFLFHYGTIIVGRIVRYPTNLLSWSVETLISPQSNTNLWNMYTYLTCHVQPLTYLFNLFEGGQYLVVVKEVVSILLPRGTSKTWQEPGLYRNSLKLDRVQIKTKVYNIIWSYGESYWKEKYINIIDYPLRFPHKNDVRFVFTSSCL
jgi:hypothetical protein